MATAWVVKLGGSLAGAEVLPHWLNALATSPVLVVPGGGPFADQVRVAQARWRFGEATAHRMALLAMAQFGHMLAGLQPGFATAAGLEFLAGLAAAGRSAIWLPDPEALERTGIPASWDVTSDSLAAWLAGQLAIPHLLLVKSAPLPSGMARFDSLAATAIVDPAFSDFAGAAGCTAWLCGAGDFACLKRGLRDPDAVFTRIALQR